MNEAVGDLAGAGSVLHFAGIFRFSGFRTKYERSYLNPDREGSDHLSVFHLAFLRAYGVRLASRPCCHSVR